MIDSEKRWQHLNEEYVVRDSAVKKILDPIDGITSVVDLGAGKQNLSSYFEERGIRYFPVDKYDSIGGTIVCDFNNKEFIEFAIDCSLVLGVLEYMYDVRWFTDKVKMHSHKYIILSYNSSPFFKKLNGWHNNFSKEELLEYFDGFSLIDEVFTYSGYVYLFKREEDE
jgi:hypothetical protein